MAGKVFALQAMVTLAGQKMVGSTRSFRMIVWRQVALLPQLSVAVQVRSMLHSGKVPIKIYTSTYVKTLVPPQLLVTFGYPVLEGSELAEQEIIIFIQVITGGSVSVSVIF